MPIHFQEDDGDFEVFLCPEDPPAEDDVEGCDHYSAASTLLGQLVQGRAMTDLSSNWTEFQFIPDDLRHETFPVRKSILAAKEDARQYGLWKAAQR